MIIIKPFKDDMNADSDYDHHIRRAYNKMTPTQVERLKQELADIEILVWPSGEEDEDGDIAVTATTICLDVFCGDAHISTVDLTAKLDELLGGMDGYTMGKDNELYAIDRLLEVVQKHRDRFVAAIEADKVGTVPVCPGTSQN